jgi:hypothetical protein
MRSGNEANSSLRAATARSSHATATATILEARRAERTTATAAVAEGPSRLGPVGWRAPAGEPGRRTQCAWANSISYDSKSSSPRALTPLATAVLRAHGGACES